MASTSPPTHAQTGPALDNRRIAAAAIDLAAPLLAAVALVATDLLTPAVALVLVGWVLYYFFALESGGGQTVGKRVMNLKVVTADGGEPTMQQYAMRTIARVVDMPIIGLVVMLVTGDRRQRLGDIAAHTSVVDVASAPALDAFDVAALQAAPPEAPKAKADKPKRSRPGLGGPELKLPSFGRSKGPKEPKPAKEPKVKSGRPTLGGPELKLPSFGRSKGPKEPKPAKEPKVKSGRPTLGGPELKMPSFGRRKKHEPVFYEPEPEAVEQPLAEPAPPVAPEPEPEIPAFDPFAENAPSPSIEVVGHGEDEAFEAPEVTPEPEPPAPEVMQGDEPEVEIVRDDVAEPPPAPVPPSIPPIPAIPAIEPELPAEEPLPAAAEHEPEVQPEPDPEPEHVEGVRDDGSSRVNVKPIETVSAMELLMRDAEERDR